MATDRRAGEQTTPVQGYAAPLAAHAGAGLASLGTLPARARLRPGRRSKLAPGNGRCGKVRSPVCWAVFELLPVAAVGVLGMLAGHPLGKFGVERVGEAGDVA